MEVEPTKTLSEAIEDCLRFHDPLCLALLGEDVEYINEAEIIADGFADLADKHSIQKRVHEVFLSLYQKGLAGNIKKYNQIAMDLHEVQHRFGKTYKAR